MRRIALAVWHAAATYSARVVAAERRHRPINEVATPTLQEHNKHSSLRKRRRMVNYIESNQDTSVIRELQDVLRYVPMKLDLSLETSQSGGIDTDELNIIIGDHILLYLQGEMTDYKAVSVETEISTLSEPVRFLEVAESQPMILQVRANGFVYFVGNSLPASEYVNEVIVNAFEGEEVEKVLKKLGEAEDPVLRSTVSAWSGFAQSKEEYLAMESSSPSVGDIIMDNIVFISAGLASGVVLIALFAGLQYRRSKKEDRDDFSLTEIPWLSVQVPKRAPKRGESDLQSTMEAPIEAVAGETTSVMIAIGGRNQEKIALKDDVSIIPKLPIETKKKEAILTRLYEQSLCDGGIFERKSISFDDDMSDVIGCGFDDPSVTKQPKPRETTTETSRPSTPETVKDQGQEIDIEQAMQQEKSAAPGLPSKIKKKLCIRKKVSLPTLKRAKSKSNKTKQSKELDAIEEGDEVSLAREETSIPVAYLANVDSDESEEDGIMAAISHTHSGIKEAWDQISRKYTMDPNWDTNTSVSSRDFENTSFQCIGPTCVSTMSDSHATDDEDMDDTIGDASDDTTDISSCDYMTQHTGSEYMSQFTNGSFSTESFSCESASTISDDGYSR